MERQLYTYSLIKSLYDKGRDYADCFWPMLICVLPSDQKALGILDVQKRVEERFGLRVPIHSIEMILTRAKNKRLVMRKDNTIWLTDQGRLQSSSLEIEREVERRVNELTDAATTFINNALKDSISAQDCKNLLLRFVQTNLDSMILFLNPTGQEIMSIVPQLAEESRELMLLRFFIEVERSNPRLYQTLLDVILGSVMSLVVYGEGPNEAKRKFSKTVVYLDTNIIFSLLSLHFQEFNKPAQELLTLVQREGQFELRSFDFTVEEIISVLKNYAVNRTLYFKNIKVASVYSSLVTNGWTNSQILDLICGIEERLSSLGILVTTTGIALDKFEPREAKMLDVIATYKPH